jgi:putative membrane protein
MLIALAVFAAVSVLLHVYIWYLESVAWTGRARAVFGTSAEEAAATRELAYNQGFYNLFLAIIAGVGIVVAAVGDRGVGTALILAGTGAMLGAAVVLLLSSPDKRVAAVKQGAAPLVTVALGVVWALIG